jgi:tetratricopeptide (TPR) repeat protein
VPFQYDDKPVIVNNPIVKDLNYFIEPSKASDFKGHFEYKKFRNRYIGYLTFALNYKFHGLDVTGYHIVNLLIHIINSLIVYFFLFLTFQTPYMRKSRVRDYAGYISFFSALLFAVHPIQTEAVTYIWQRVTALTAMFYLLSLTAYIKARIGSHKTELHVKESGRWTRKQGFYYVTAVIFAVLAMKTKEIAFTLPITIALYEIIFLEGSLRKRVLYLAPLFLTMILIPISHIDLDKPIDEFMGSVSEATRDKSELSRLDYLLTEYRVIITYLRLVFVPVNQNLGYDYPLYSSFFDHRVFLSFLFLLLIFGLGIFLLCRYRKKVAHTRLIAFGIFWFFITLSVESSIIPIRGVIFEYRMYLPSIGIFASVVTIIFSGASKIKERWKMTVVTTVLFLFIVSVLLSMTTYARNKVWKSEISLWSDVVSKSPESIDARYSLGNAYRDAGFYHKAITEYKIVADKSPDNGIYNNLGLAYQATGLINKAVEYYTLATEVNPEDALAYSNIAYIHFSSGQYDKAIDLYKLAIKINPNIFGIHANLGSVYWSNNLLDEAIKEYETAIRLSPYSSYLHLNLGNIYRSKGQVNKAAQHITIAINLKDDSPKAHLELGKIYMSQGLNNKAIDEFRITLEQDPGSFSAHNNLGIIYGSSGRMGEALKHLKDAIRIKPDYPEAHNNLGNALKSQGLHDQAIKEYETAIRLRPEYYIAYNNLGIAYGSAKRLDEAIEIFKKAIQIRPDSPRAHANLGIAYKVKGLIDDAIESFNSALKIDPDFALAHFNLGIIYMEKGDHEIAKKEFERVLQIDPDNRNALQALKSLNER